MAEIEWFEQDNGLKRPLLTRDLNAFSAICRNDLQATLFASASRSNLGRNLRACYPGATQAKLSFGDFHLSY
jgi:hypothetical protein